MLTSDVQSYVQQACLRSENIFSPAFFDEHLAEVAQCATRLATELGADREIVELAAYLHDISAILDYSSLADHARLGADAASRILQACGFPSARAAAVAAASIRHSTPLALGSASVEAVCISNADAMSRLLHPAYWLYYAFSVRKLSFSEGRTWFRSLIEKEWGLMIEPARKMVAGHYAIAMNLLDQHEAKASLS